MTRAPWIASFLMVLVIAAVLFLRYRERLFHNPTADASGGKPGMNFMGHAGNDVGPVLHLRVVNVRQKQKLVDSPPWIADGGNATAFDCVPAEESAPIFTVVAESPQKQGSAEIPIAFASVTIIVPDRVAGRRFVELMARTFSVDVPREKSPQSLRPTRINTALLGENAARENGVFTANPGGWTATKWFLQNDGFDGETYFNYSLNDGLAEFTQKDVDYNQEVVGALAIDVRDGPRPPRTPKTDPNLTDDGPSLTDMKTLPIKDATASFLPDDRILLHDRHVAWIATPSDPTHLSELAHVDGELGRVLLLDPAGNLLAIHEQIHSEPNTFSPDDPQHLWLIDRRTAEKKPIQGPWKDQGQLDGDTPASPDGRFIAITYFDRPGKSQPGKSVLCFYDRNSGATRIVSRNEIEVMGWTSRDSQLFAVGLLGDRYVPGKQRQALLLNPLTGETSDPPPGIALPGITDAGVSPDGKSLLKVHPPDSLEIEDRQSRTTREFHFHEDDERYVQVENLCWLSPRYLRFDANRMATIDVTTLKMHYVTMPNEERRWEFNKSFNWAVSCSTNEVVVARIQD